MQERQISFGSSFQKAQSTVSHSVLGQDFVVVVVGVGGKGEMFTLWEPVRQKIARYIISSHPSKLLALASP